MNNHLTTVPLDRVMTRVDRGVAPQPGTIYRQIGVRLWGEGAYERESIDGADTKYAQLFRAEAGDLIVNKIWARNGSVAVVPDFLSGSYGSSEFPMFEPNRKVLDPRWMHWLTKTRGFWAQCDDRSRGTSGKNRIKPEQLLAVEIPLPPLSEQRRIVARIEAVAAKTHVAHTLRQQAAEEAKMLWTSTLATAFDDDVSARGSLDSVCDAIIDNLHSTPRYDGDSFPCIRSQDVGWGDMRFDAALRTSEQEFTERTRRGEPCKGDIVFVREGDVGRCAVVDGNRRFSLGQRVMLLRPSQRIEPRFLMLQLMSQPVLETQILKGITGTTSHHVNIKHLRKVSVVIPPLSQQRRILADLDLMQVQLKELRRNQEQTSEALDALLPSIVDKAFRGEL